MIQILEKRTAKMNEEMETIRNRIEDKTDAIVKLQSEKLTKSIKCNICEHTFQNIL